MLFYLLLNLEALTRLNDKLSLLTKLKLIIYSDKIFKCCYLYIYASMYWQPINDSFESITGQALK